MTRGHDQFESLAGAIALGEATNAERATFAAHAASCERCRPDLEADPQLPSALRELAFSETWRPSVRAGLATAIAVRRRTRTWAVGSGLATAAALSIALDAGVSSGALGRFAAHVVPEPAAASPVAFVRVKLAPPARVRMPPATVAVVRPHRTHASRAALPAAVATRHATVSPSAAADDESTLPSVDLLSGLAIDPEAEKRAPHVAKADTREAASSEATAAP